MAYLFGSNSTKNRIRVMGIMISSNKTLNCLPENSGSLFKRNSDNTTIHTLRRLYDIASEADSFCGFESIRDKRMLPGSVEVWISSVIFLSILKNATSEPEIIALRKMSSRVSAAKK